MPGFSCEIPLVRASVWSLEPLPGLAPRGPAVFGTGEPEVAFVPALLRRRLSPAARGMLHCAGQAAGAEPGLRTVFASRHGEMQRTLALMQELHAGAGLSPALFSLSVHNAVAGLWSIAKASRAPSASLAAGPDSFGWGLVEAYGTWREDGASPVLYVYGDDALPEPFRPYVQGGAGVHALALLIGGPAAASLRLSWTPGPARDEPAVPQAHHFLRALAGAPEAAPWAARGGAWDWRLA